MHLSFTPLPPPVIFPLELIPVQNPEDSKTYDNILHRM